MPLHPIQLKYFFDVLGGFLLFVNEKTQLRPEIESLFDFVMAPPEVKEALRDAAFADDRWIEEFVRTNPYDWDEEELNLVRSWTHRVAGEFVIERVTDDGIVFIKDGKVYLVEQTFMDIRSQVQYFPYIGKTVLLPCGNRIIYDGVLTGTSIRIPRSSDEPANTPEDDFDMAEIEAAINAILREDSDSDEEEASENGVADSDDEDDLDVRATSADEHVEEEDEDEHAAIEAALDAIFGDPLGPLGKEDEDEAEPEKEDTDRGGADHTDANASSASEEEEAKEEDEEAARELTERMLEALLPFPFAGRRRRPRLDPAEEERLLATYGEAIARNEYTRLYLEAKEKGTIITDLQPPQSDAANG